MDELPKEARALLDLAREGHEPPFGAQERVQARVSAALAAGVVLGSAGKVVAAGVKKGLFAGVGAKVALTSAAAVVVGGSLMMVAPLAIQNRGAVPAPASAPVIKHAPSSVQREVPEPVLAEAAEIAVGAPSQTPPTAPLEEPVATEERARTSTRASVSAHRARHARAEDRQAPVSAPADQLREEMSLLRAATASLDRGDTNAAAEYLAQYRHRFGLDAALKAEERGLSAIVRCLGGEQGAPKAAARLLKEGRVSVLSARLRSACKLRDEEP